MPDVVEPSGVTVEQAREAYRMLRLFIVAEEERRQRYLHGANQREALKEADAALTNLRTLGEFVGFVVRNPDYEQGGLL